MSRGVENNACVISLNRFETTSRGGFGEWSVWTRRNQFEPIPLLQCGRALRATCTSGLGSYKIYCLLHSFATVA